MFIIQSMQQIVWFNFVYGNHTSIHLIIIGITLHQRIRSYLFIIQRIRKIFAETATMVIIFLDNASKMALSIDLTPKKMIELKNDILAQKNKNILVAKGSDFDMAWNAQDWNEFD